MGIRLSVNTPLILQLSWGTRPEPSTCMAWGRNVRSGVALCVVLHVFDSDVVLNRGCDMMLNFGLKALYKIYPLLFIYYIHM